MKLKSLGLALLTCSFSAACCCQTITIKKDRGEGALFHSEVECEFIGGTSAWKKYLDSNLNTLDFTGYFISPQKDSSIEISILFAVDTLGNITDINISAKDTFPTLLLTKIRKIFAQAPRWRPASQNNKPVKSFKEQHLTIIIPRNED